jgi:hypothetical protein
VPKKSEERFFFHTHFSLDFFTAFAFFKLFPIFGVGCFVDKKNAVEMVDLVLKYLCQEARGMLEYWFALFIDCFERDFSWRGTVP